MSSSRRAISLNRRFHWHLCAHYIIYSLHDPHHMYHMTRMLIHIPTVSLVSLKHLYLSPVLCWSCEDLSAVVSSALHTQNTTPITPPKTTPSTPQRPHPSQKNRTPKDHTHCNPPKTAPITHATQDQLFNLHTTIMPSGVSIRAMMKLKKLPIVN